MRDRELNLYEILYGGCVMALPFFLCPDGTNWRLLLPFAASFCLFEVSSRKRSVLLYLLSWIALGALIPRAGRNIVESVCLLGGVVLGGIGYFCGRWKSEYGFFGGPSYPILVLPAVVYVVGYVEEFVYLENRACVFAAAVFLLCVLSRNRLELLSYMKENKKLHRFPGKRLEQKNRNTMAVFTLLLVGVMALAYWRAPADPRLPELQPVDLSELIDETEEIPDAGGEMDMKALLGGEEPAEPPAWLTVLGNIFYWVALVAVGVGLTALILRGIYKLIFAYRNQYGRRQPEKINSEEDVMENLAPPKFSVPKLFRRRTPSEQIRKTYKKWILSGPGQTPGLASTPTEAEAEAKVQDEGLHDLYEKARYGREECTQDDLSRIRRRQS